MKPTRTFTICTAPVVLPSEKGDPVLIQPALLHEVRGCEVKYVDGRPEGMLHVIDAKESVVFSSPVHLVLWLKQEDIEPKLKLVVGGAIDV